MEDDPLWDVEFSSPRQPHRYARHHRDQLGAFVTRHDKATRHPAGRTCGGIIARIVGMAAVLLAFTWRSR